MNGRYGGPTAPISRRTVNDNTADSPKFGHVVSAQSPRFVSLSIKITFHTSLKRLEKEALLFPRFFRGADLLVVNEKRTAMKVENQTFR
jgi:hypothetical protein